MYKILRFGLKRAAGTSTAAAAATDLSEIVSGGAAKAISGPSPVPSSARCRKASTVATFPSLSPLHSRNRGSIAHSLRFHRHFAMAPFAGLRAAQDLRAALQAEKRRVGLGKDHEDDGDEDYTGVKQRIAKLERRVSLLSGQDDRYVEPSDSEAEEDDRFDPRELMKREAEFNQRCNDHGNLLNNFAKSENLDEADKWMRKIEQFEQRHFKLPLEYRVIGEMMNRLKDASGKERFILLQKLNRAVRLAESRRANDPNDPANYGEFSHRRNFSVYGEGDQGAEEGKPSSLVLDDEDSDDDSERSAQDDALLEKLNAIDRKLEERLAVVDRTFGKKGRALQDEIKQLAQERYSLTTEGRTPLRRKGFDVKLIDVNQTCRVTKGGRLFKFKVILACGNYDGAVGFAKGKGPTVNEAIQRAHEKCFENLHYVERYEEHTIAHAIQSKYGKTKIYLWPARTATGVVAGKTVETILLLAGYKNVKSKIVGSRNPFNTVKALFQALNAIETPKDVQEKFGRTVVESYLL